jgi:hypothetical protein
MIKNKIKTNLINLQYHILTKILILYDNEFKR